MVVHDNSDWLGELEALEASLREGGRGHLADQAAKLLAEARDVREAHSAAAQTAQSADLERLRAAVHVLTLEASLAAAEPFGLPPWQSAPPRRRSSSSSLAAQAPLPAGPVPAANRRGPVVGELSGELVDPNFVNDLFGLLARCAATGVLEVSCDDLQGHVRFSAGAAIDGLLVALTDVGAGARRAIPLLGGEKAIDRVRLFDVGTFTFTAAPAGFK